MVECVVGLQPNVACEFKRAGFLEWQATGKSLLTGHKPAVIDLARVDNNRDGLIAVVSCPSELNRSAAVV